MKEKIGYDVTDYFTDGHTPEEFKTMLQNNSTGEDSMSHDIQIYTLTEMLKDDTPPPPAIISHGVLPKNGILLIHGSPKAGKSLLSCNLALSIASGINWFGFTVEVPIRTLIIQAEVNYFPLRERFKTMVQDEYKKATDNIIVTEAKGFDILSEEGCFQLQRWIVEFKPEVIIFDPLKDYHYKEENSNTEMAMVFQRFREIVEKYDVSIIIVHHSKKYNDSGSGDNIRGASNIFGSIDAAIELKRDKKGNRTLKFDLRYGKQPDDISIDLNEITLMFEMMDFNPVNENESKLMEIVKDYEPDGISKTELQKNWMKVMDKGKTVYYVTFKECESKLEKNGNKIHILDNVLPL